HTRFSRDWSSDVCSSDLWEPLPAEKAMAYDELVAKRLQFTYPFEQAMLNRAKQSVTEIKRRFETSDAYSERRVIRTFKKIATERSEERRVGKEAAPRREP